MRLLKAASRRHDLTYLQLLLLIEDHGNTDFIDQGTAERMSDVHLRQAILRVGVAHDERAAYLGAIFQQELADRAGRANRLTMLIAAASLAATIIGIALAG